MPENGEKLREIVAEVAAAYFSNSHVSANDIPNVINQIASSLMAVGGGQGEVQGSSQAAGAAEEPEQRKLTPAQIRKSITPDALISFEDGKSYKTLRRHLSGKGLTPEQYREKWGLPKDYPMVAPSYSATRSQLAKNLGLGQMRQQRAAAAAAESGNGGAAKAKGRAKGGSTGAKRGGGRRKAPAAS